MNGHFKVEIKTLTGRITSVGCGSQLMWSAEGEVKVKEKKKKNIRRVIQQHPHLRVSAGDHVGGQTDDLVALGTHVHSLKSRKHSEITRLKK